MGNLLKYSGVVSKVRGLKRKLLKPKEFEEISELKSVSDFVSYLKNKPGYSEEFMALDENKINRGDVEKMLLKSLYNDYSGLYLFSGVSQKKFLKLYLKRYEVGLINYCLRIVYNKYPQPFDILSKKLFFDKYSDISMEKVIEATNVDELIEALKGSEYYKVLNDVKERGVNDIFSFDLALNMYYYCQVWKKKNKVLKGSELKSFTNDIGIQIDLLNIEWIYRAKKYFDMSPADIYNILTPIHYKIPMNVFKDLVEAPTVDEFEKVFANTNYGKKFDKIGKFNIAQKREAYLIETYKKDYRTNPYSIATINTYLHLKELEIEKLTSALECIRYGLSPREILAQIRGAVK